MWKGFFAIALCLILFGPVASAASEVEVMIESLRWVETADPINDADQAIKAKDFRLLGIAGRGVSVPGLPEDSYWLYTKKYGINVIKGTSDIVWGGEHSKLIEAATRYAETYNNRLLESLRVLQPSNKRLQIDAATPRD